jgi:hypothetical protein
MAITRLSGGLTPANGADPRTFPAVWNGTADDLEAGEYSRVPQGGSAGEVLVKQSATDWDAAWVGLPNTVDPRTSQGPAVGWTSGYTSHFGTSTTRTVSTNRQLWLMSFPLFGTQAFTHIGVQVDSTTANAGAVGRLGIFTANLEDFRYYDVLLDAGTVALDTSGVKEIAITQTLTPGVYYFGIMTEGLSSGSIVFSAVANSSPFMPARLSSGSLTRGSGTLASLASDGPWPATITNLASNAFAPPYVFLRYLA